jgi:hypothetical protein
LTFALGAIVPGVPEAGFDWEHEAEGRTQLVHLIVAQTRSQVRDHDCLLIGEFALERIELRLGHQQGRVG